jgi:hypothetical protein
MSVEIDHKKLGGGSGLTHEHRHRLSASWEKGSLVCVSLECNTEEQPTGSESKRAESTCSLEKDSVLGSVGVPLTLPFTQDLIQKQEQKLWVTSEPIQQTLHSAGKAILHACCWAK